MATILALILAIFVGPFAHGPQVKVERNEAHNLIESFPAMNPCTGTGCR